MNWRRINGITPQCDDDNENEQIRSLALMVAVAWWLAVSRARVPFRWLSDLKLHRLWWHNEKLSTEWLTEIPWINLNWNEFTYFLPFLFVAASFCQKGDYYFRLELILLRYVSLGWWLFVEATATSTDTEMAFIWWCQWLFISSSIHSFFLMPNVSSPFWWNYRLLNWLKHFSAVSSY